jgi:hypothetical protein
MMQSAPVFRKNRTITAALAVALALGCQQTVGAQAPVAGPPAAATSATASAPEKAKIIALLAAVGDQFQYVRQKEGVGSHLEPFTRRSVTVPDQLLNRMVLRGMDRAVSAQYPDAEVVMMTLRPDPPELKILPQDREAHTMGRVMAMLQDYPDRIRWHEIMVVTPKWLMSERQGMGSKLSGIGLYVQPLVSTNADPMGDGALEDEVRDTGEFKKTRSSRYVAPFFYIKITVLDANTLKVIRTDERYDYRKMINSDSAALDVQNTFTPEKLAAEVERFVETAARRLVVDKEGSVEIGPLKTTRPAPQIEKK